MTEVKRSLTLIIRVCCMHHVLQCQGNSPLHYLHLIDPT